MRQYYPLAFHPFMTLADAIGTGLNQLEDSVGVMLNRTIHVRRESEAARTTNERYQASAAETKAAVAAKDATAREVKEFISRARDVLKRFIGPRYSREWCEAGFRTPTLRIPRAGSVQQNVLTSLQLYFVAHPEAQLPAWGVTAERAAELHELAVARASAVNTARAAQRQLKAERNAAVKALRTRLRRVRQELKQLLAPNDPRWLTFGFSAPADVSVPEPPQDVTITTVAPGKAELSWSSPVNAERFHIYQETGEAGFVRIATVTGTSKDISPQLSGARERFYLTAVNGAGESRASEIADYVVP